MDLSFRHDRWFARLPRSPRDEGRVAMLVRRTGSGTRDTPERVEIDAEGVVGDAWRDRPDQLDGSQVSVMNVHVARSCADGDDARMALAGDNLLVDLDLSEENLPVGTLLHVGDAVLAVSDVPHRPCRSFHDRFGALAAKRVARAGRVGLRGRGVLCRVARPGGVAVGDAVRVERPGPSRPQ